MRNRSKLLLAVFAATLFMSVVAGGASARRIEVSWQEYAIKWEGTAGRWLLFGDEGGHRVSCEVTLGGSFHSKTISKVSGQLVGHVYRVNVTNCQGGTARANAETLPWHVQYNSFTGTLPNITSITQTLVNSNFEVESEGIKCRSGTTQTNPAWGRATVSSGRITEYTALREHRIPLSGLICGFVSPGWFEGTARADRGSTTESITVRLVQ